MRAIQKTLNLTQNSRTPLTYIWASPTQKLRQKSELVFLVLYVVTTKTYRIVCLFLLVFFFVFLVFFFFFVGVA